MAATVTFIKTLWLHGAQQGHIEEDYSVQFHNDQHAVLPTKLKSIDAAHCIPVGAAGNAAILSVNGVINATDGRVTFTGGTTAVSQTGTSIDVWLVSLFGR